MKDFPSSSQDSDVSILIRDVTASVLALKGQWEQAIILISVKGQSLNLPSDLVLPHELFKDFVRAAQNMALDVHNSLTKFQVYVVGSAVDSTVPFSQKCHTSQKLLKKISGDQMPERTLADISNSLREASERLQRRVSPADALKQGPTKVAGGAAAGRRPSVEPPLKADQDIGSGLSGDNITVERAEAEFRLTVHKLYEDHAALIRSIKSNVDPVIAESRVALLEHNFERFVDYTESYSKYITHKIAETMKLAAAQALVDNISQLELNFNVVVSKLAEVRVITDNVQAITQDWITFLESPNAQEPRQFYDRVVNLKVASAMYEPISNALADFASKLT